MVQNIENIVGEGRFRQIFRINQGECVKVLKPKLVKHYGSLKVNFPLYWYTLLKYGVSDLNEFELLNYRRLMKGLPSNASQFFAPIL